MSIRIGLYDFFAYTLPGILYVAILTFWLNTIGILAIDFSVLKDFSLIALFMFVGAGYITGLIFDPIAFRLIRFFIGRNRDATKAAYEKFTERHPWVNLKYEAKDWSILLRAIKSVSMEAATDVEQHNVTFIMLRNIGFAFILCFISSGVYYFVTRNLWDLGLGILFLTMAILAMWRSKIRREWFYIAVFEAFTAHFLLDNKIDQDSKSYEEGSVLTMSQQLEFVEKRIAEDIAFFTNRRNYNRTMAFRFSLFPAILSTIATIAIGIEDKTHLVWLPVVAIIASGIASILGAWQSLFANKTLWMANNSTLANLHKLQWDIDYRKADKKSPMKEEEIKSYYTKLSEIHDEAESALQQAYKT